MTDLAVVEEVVLEESVLEGDSPHIKCCLRDLFLCGAQWHPEAAAVVGDPLDEVCRRCHELAEDAQCGGHVHCPLNLRQTCPPMRRH